MTKKILLGKITTAFGIKGEVKIESYCQNPQDIEKYELFDDLEKNITLKISNKNKAVVGHVVGGAILIARVNNITNRSEAELLRGKELFSYRKNFKQVKKNEFYHSDLIGLDVVNEKLEKIGTVLAINNYGAGDMVEINFLNSKIKKNYEDIDNFPFKNEIFPEVNLEKNYILIKSAFI
jgi:16S rRNA processing protein RimM